MQLLIVKGCVLGMIGPLAFYKILSADSRGSRYRNKLYPVSVMDEGFLKKQSMPKWGGVCPIVYITM